MGKIKEDEKIVDNEVNAEKKGNAGKYIVLLVIVFLFAFLFGYYVSNIGKEPFSDENVSETEKENKNEDEEINKVRELNETEKNVLVEQIKAYNIRIPELYGAEINLDNQRLLQFAAIYAQGKTSFAENEERVFSAEKVEAVIKKYFNVVGEIQHTNIKCDVCGDDRFIYNADTKVYTYNKNQSGHGGAGMIPDSYVHYLSGSVENEKDVVVKTKILYAGWCGDICLNFCSAYYGTYDDARNNKNHLLGNPSSENEIVVTDDMYASVADKLKTTVFTFVKDTEGNYGLKSVTFE